MIMNFGLHRWGTSLLPEVPVLPVVSPVTSGYVLR